jgi:streptomycin 6-kinase
MDSSLLSTRQTARPDPRGSDQAAVAGSLASLGAAPRVHEAVSTGHGTWTVLDRVLPGTPLSHADPATVNPQALLAPLAAMRDQPPPRPGMPSIFDWLRDRLQDDHLTDLRPGTTVAPASERRTALDVLGELAQDHMPALCHGDASSGNIIANGADGWMYIDPRGVTGEHAYDAAVLAIRITTMHSRQSIKMLTADLAQVNIDRLAAWMTVAAAARV